ncbi:hypothetical protein, partial [Mesotoga prima]|uniref:hypothetical protein n=1 Tax=Mesotoga prima TaxID=1184387 RepID=UPI002BCA0556
TPLRSDAGKSIPGSDAPKDPGGSDARRIIRGSEAASQEVFSGPPSPPRIAVPRSDATRPGCSF